MKRKKENSECSLLIQANTYIIPQKVQSGKVVEDDHILDKWYIRLIAYIITPLYLAIKIYDLTKFLKRLFHQFLSGVLQTLLFLFCFGWIWQTPLIDKLRKTRPFRVVVRYKLHYHLLNISSTILQARQFITTPSPCSELVSREMNCISEKAKNNSDTVTDLMKSRYDALHNRIEGLQNTTKKRMADIQDRIDRVGDQVRKKYSFLQSVINKVNTFEEKCHQTMGKLNTKCKDLFDDGCKKDKKRDVAGLTYYNQTENFLTTVSPVIDELPHLTSNLSETLGTPLPLETNVYHNKSQFLAHHPVSTLHGGKVYHVRQKRFWNDVVCFLKKVVGFVARPICSIIFNSINFMCSVPKLLTHFIAGIILQKYEYLQLTFQNNLRLEREQQCRV
eukprot:sb/3465530/